MLRNAEATPDEQRNPDLLRPATGEDGLTKLLQKFQFSERVSLMLDQAGSTSTPSKVLGSCILAGIVGVIAGLKFHFSLSPELTAFAGGAIGTALPFLLLLRKRK